MLGSLCSLNNSLQLSCTKNVTAVLLAGSELDIKLNANKSSTLQFWVFVISFSIFKIAPEEEQRGTPVHAKSMLKILIKDPATLLSPLAAGASTDILENKSIIGGCNNSTSSLF